MIPLRRDRERVTAALRGTRRVKKNLELVDLWASGALGSHKWKSDRWKPAKLQLKAETHGKCAYCEADTSVVAHGDVEHFRPKSVYWWLAYCYDNYLYSCQICNQSYKGDHFEVAGAPLAPPPALPGSPSGLTPATRDAVAAQLTPDPKDPAAGRDWPTFWAELDAEGAALLMPYHDDPGVHFAWSADPTLRQVRLIAAAPASQRYVDAAEALLGLNRDELLNLRFKRFEELAFVAELVADHGGVPTPAMAGRLAAYTSDDAQFAGMCRWFLTRWAIPF